MLSSKLIPLVLVLVMPVTAALAAENPARHATPWTTAPDSGEPLAATATPAHDTPPAPALRVGWPVNLQCPSAGYPYTPTLFDADLDGADEIFLTGGHTFGLRGDGTFLPGWPTVEQAYMGYGTNDQKPGPSAADLSGDGDVEILWSERDWYAGSARMWCFNGKNVDATNLPGFPQEAIEAQSNALDVPFVLGDVDVDGDLEAWGPHTRGNNFIHYRVSGFDHLGTRLFTTDVNAAENILSLYFGDVDGDGHAEMFAVSFVTPSLKLHVFTAAGGEQAGYPITLHTFSGGYLPFGPPVPVDLDGDGNLEILIGHWDGAGSRVYARHHDGTAVAGYPKAIATSSQLYYIALGDVTGDGRPELVATDNHLTGDNRVFALDLATGALLPGWPVNVVGWPEGFPTVVDVDNDGYQDVCVATDAGDLRAFNRNGQLLAGYPLFMAAPSISGVAAGDIDGDGLFELVAATWNGLVYAWDTTGEALPGRADWPLRNVDARNTGVYGGSPYAAAVLAATPLLDELALRVAPNPIGARAEFAIEGALRPVVIEIVDMQGRIIDRLAPASAGRASWSPGEAANGVYFARLRGGSAAGVKFLVLR